MPEAERLRGERSGPDADLDLLAGAAAEGGAIAQRFFRKNPDVWLKGGKSPVSEADIAVDRFLYDALTSARPAYGWLSEETADNPLHMDAERVFIVDPIDGTRAFLKGKPTWCVSVAVVERGRPVAGALACPELGEIFVASAGHGAKLNGRQIAVATDDERMRIAGPATMVDIVADDYRGRLVRQPYIPSLAYRIAMVAKGALDATFVRPNAHDWDIAAADLVLAEAGGEIRIAAGGPPRYLGPGANHGAMVAGSGILIDHLHLTIQP